MTKLELIGKTCNIYYIYRREGWFAPSRLKNRTQNIKGRLYNIHTSICKNYFSGAHIGLNFMKCGVLA